MKNETKIQLAIILNTKNDKQKLSFKLLNRKIAFPKLPCEILNLEIALNKNSSEVSEEENESTSRTTGAISGIFSVPRKKFSKPFLFKIPFSIKYGTAIALSFAKKDETKEINTLNKFLFGDQEITPTYIPFEIVFDLAYFMLNLIPEGNALKEYVDKAIKYLENNINMSINFLIDNSKKIYSVGFYWPEFDLLKFGLPKNLKIKDIIVGLSLDFKSESTNKIALKIGGNATYKDEEKLYLEYEIDNYEQRLEFGCAFSVLTTILNKMQVQIPDQLEDLAGHTFTSVEWIADVGKNIENEMR